MDHVRRDVEIRHRIMSIYNKEEEDFSSKLEYDDYLEEREDIIFNLVERIQVAEMEAKISRYTQENGESIARNEARKLQRILGTRAQKEEKDVDEVEDVVFPGIHDDSMVHLPIGDEVKTQTKEEWNKMALCSGWNTEMQRAKCIHVFTSSLHIVAS